MTPALSRSEAADVVAGDLLQRASLLTRLLLRSGDRSLTRTEAAMLSTLCGGPRRITELAETEVLAQPTVTQLVDKLERRGLVARERSRSDGRVVLVSVAPAGRAALESVRAQNRAHLRDHFDALTDAELATLAAATETLARIIDAVQQDVEG